jgi:hypothetical protein
MEMNCIGIVFGNRWYIFIEIGGLGFGIAVCVVITVKCVRLNSTLNKIPVVRNFTVIILYFIFILSSAKLILSSNRVNQCVRKPVR